MDATYSQWMSRWKVALEASQRMGGEAGELIIMPPASPEAVTEVETQLGMALPLSFKTATLEFSSQVEVAWTLPEEATLPPKLEGIFCGLCDWSLEGMVELNAWLKDFLLDEDDSFDDNWRNALLFSHVPNGDYLAFDTRITPDPPVIYLSHEESKTHGQMLGSNFVDFMDRWSLLGCPGNEDWQMMPFLPEARSGLDPHGENARKWREWFGLDLEVNTQ